MPKWAYHQDSFQPQINEENLDKKSKEFGISKDDLRKIAYIFNIFESASIGVAIRALDLNDQIMANALSVISKKVCDDEFETLTRQEQVCVSITIGMAIGALYKGIEEKQPNQQGEP